MRGNRIETEQNKQQEISGNRIELTFLDDGRRTYLNVDKEGNVRINLGGGSFFLLSSMTFIGCIATLEFCSRVPEIIRAISGK